MADFNSIRFQPSRPLLKEVSADRLNLILAEIKKNRPRGEHGISVRQAGDATYIGLASSLKKDAGAQFSPWDIYVVDSTAENEYTLKVRPGTLAGILPSNWESEFSASGTSLYYGIAKVSTDGQYINGVEIVITDEPPAAQSVTRFGLQENIDILFGLFKEGASYNVTGGKDISVSQRNVVVTVPEEPPQPGNPQFDLWFRLQ